mgnify:CR=1 FL=1
MTNDNEDPLALKHTHTRTHARTHPHPHTHNVHNRAGFLVFLHDIQTHFAYFLAHATVS